ncbi:SAM-dependent methyltransferase [Amycolatopsis vastitatis]|uniref:Tetrapyrrole methylase domain-containing protein n=1 Tax=Amycolatopsis vastitatis TaxID=1905142 RepID=A0A229TB74_9PSEU|nr:SAM-dependent methyltransferase [Amycolatopsis vastitatis]OXM68492.1 hypothetical protein CF165_13370 [Amycolatopsis vastitatis]
MTKIRLVGIGMLPQRDLTAGGLAALRASKVVLYSSFPHLRPWLGSLGLSRIEDICDHYADGGKDVDNYTAIVGAVVGAARRNGDVAYLVPGHPNLGVTATQRFLAMAATDDELDVEVVPGVSSIDTISMDLSLDLLERTCVIVDSNRLLLLRQQLDPRAGVLVYHASAVGTTTTDYREPWITNRIELLQRYLVDTFGEDHEYHAVVSQTVPGVRPRVSRGTLGKLSEAVRSIDYGTTLYVPPIVKRGVDENFLRLLDSGVAATRGARE